MKKFVSAILALALVLCVSSAAFAATYNEAKGTVTAIGDAQITVTLADNSELIFNVSASTAVFNAENGAALTLADVAVGDSFTAWHDAANTRSIPAQAYLHTLILTKAGGESYAHEFTVGSIEKVSGGVLLTNAAGDLLLTLPTGASVKQMTNSAYSTINAASIKAGARLIVWYKAVAASYPAQASTATVLMLQNGTGAGLPGASIPQTGSNGAGALLLCLALIPIAIGVVRLKRGCR